MIVRLLIFWIFLVSSLHGQIRELEIKDFSAGFINGVANAFLPENAATVLSNYDLDDGTLSRRSGMGFLWAGSGAPYVGGLFSYSEYRTKRLFATTYVASHFGSDTASAYTQVLARYQPDGHHFDSVMDLRAFNGPWRALQYDARTDHAQVFHRLFVSGFNSDFIYMTDSMLIPARPRAPGQALVHSLNGGGNVTGLVRYRYYFIDVDAPDTSNFSVPTFITYVDNGKVYLYDMDTALDAEGVDSIGIYRETDGDEKFEFLARIPEGQTYYLDNTASTNDADTLVYLWGQNPKPTTLNCTDTTDCVSETHHPIAPGEISDMAVVDYGLANYFDIEILGGTPDNCHYILYTYRYIDSLGRSSYWAPWHPLPLSCIDGRRDSIGVHVRLYQLPRDSGITKIQFARCYLAESPYGTGLDTLDIWYTHASFLLTGNEADTLIDFRGAASLDSIYGIWKDEDISTIMYDDSVWVFDPSIIEHHADRMWGAGNLEYPDYLYYSASGAPTTVQGFIRVASQQGDGITGLLSVADVDYYDDALPADQMVVFKAASIWLLSGFTFTNYRLSQLMSGVGLVAPRGYCKTNLGVYFVGADGLYKIGEPKPLSLLIQATVDSAKTYISRSVLKAVGDEVWWAIPVADSVPDRTLVWSTTPKPHWESHDFAMRDVIPYDTTQDWTAHTTDRSLILTEGDSIFRWNYSETDSLDGVDTILAVYQSKYHFEGGGREQIFWVDIAGTGTVDSLKLIFYRNYGENKPGVPFDSVIMVPDFSDHKLDRAIVGAICENFSVRIEDFGMGNYTLKGYTIGWEPWDGGKP